MRGLILFAIAVSVAFWALVWMVETSAAPATQGGKPLAFSLLWFWL